MINLSLKGSRNTGNGRGTRQRAASRRSQSARERALAALSAIRRGASFSRAARDNGVTSRTIRRYAGSALVQDRPGGRIRATKADRLVRYLVIPGPDGAREISVRGSKTASEFAKYKAAVNRFLRGDGDAIAAWHGKKIAGIELITAGSTLMNLARQRPASIFPVPVVLRRYDVNVSPQKLCSTCARSVCDVRSAESDDVELHHIGGRNHVAWFTIPLCQRFHVELTTAILRAGVDMRYTRDEEERLRRARQAIYVCLWFLDAQSQPSESKRGQNENSA